MILRKILILLSAFLLFSCAEKELAPPKEFDAKIEISTLGSNYTASYEKRDGYDKITIESPDYLAGTEFTLTDGVCSVRCGDLVLESENFKAVFDFLPVSGECEKTMGSRVYRIYDLRGLE